MAFNVENNICGFLRVYKILNTFSYLRGNITNCLIYLILSLVKNYIKLNLKLNIKKKLIIIETKQKYLKNKLKLENNICYIT